jgi:hypothetical protein
VKTAFVPLTVEKAAEFRDTTHYKVSAGKDGGEPVTVRVGRFGVFACLTCYKTDCIHASAARGFALEEEAAERAASPDTATTTR